MCDRYLDMCVDKTYQNSDWREMKDRKELQEHAALDLHAHIRLHRELIKRLNNARHEGLIPTPNIVAGKKVQLTYRGKTCATGELQFVGGTGTECPLCVMDALTCTLTRHTRTQIGEK